MSDSDLISEIKTENPFLLKYLGLKFPRHVVDLDKKGNSFELAAILEVLDHALQDRDVDRAQAVVRELARWALLCAHDMADGCAIPAFLRGEIAYTTDIESGHLDAELKKILETR